MSRPPTRRSSTCCITDAASAVFDEVRKDIWPAVESRKLQLPIDKVYKFDEIGKAFEHMEANKHLGKIVVTL